ncbi:MAG: hypothetical protein R2792_14675, partial [Saprospiraceae bacterium]
TPAKGKALIKKALKLDPNNVDAYIYLGSINKDPHQAAEYFKKGMELGKEQLDEATFEEMKGHFWNFHETIPYMVAKEVYAECLCAIGKIDEPIKQFNELLALNVNDNRGIRFRLATLLLIAGRYSEYETHSKNYHEKGSAPWLFLNSIYLFLKEGESTKTKKTLAKAHKANKHVLAMIAEDEDLPDDEDIPDSYWVGDEDEALVIIMMLGDLLIQNKPFIQYILDYYFSLEQNA